MRHSATIEFIEGVKVHEKLTYLNEISVAKGLIYNDITSANEDEVITAYFTAGDIDSGRIVFEQKKIKISMNFSFQDLISLVEFTNTHYGENVLDLIRQETEEGYPPVEGRDPVITA